MANNIKQITRDNGDKANLGDIEIAAIKGVEQGNNTLTGNDFTVNGINLTPNNIGTTLLGLNPTWIQNFGGATLAAGDHTTDTHMLDVLTPTNTLFKMALALKKVASQGSAVSAAQAGQIFGGTGVAGSLQSMTSAAVSYTHLRAHET